MAKEKQAPLGKSVKIKIPSQNLEIDPRGKSRLAVGNKQPVSGSGAARRQKDVTWV